LNSIMKEDKTQPTQNPQGLGEVKQQQGKKEFL
jgi:hypothetical protein